MKFSMHNLLLRRLLYERCDGYSIWFNDISDLMIIRWCSGFLFSGGHLYKFPHKVHLLFHSDYTVS